MRCFVCVSSGETDFVCLCYVVLFPISISRACVCVCVCTGAGVTEALCIVTPFEVVKIRLQQHGGTYKGPLDAAAKILRHEGVAGLWSGAMPTVMRNGTNQVRTSPS